MVVFQMGSTWSALDHENFRTGNGGNACKCATASSAANYDVIVVKAI
jgi:hypothetical protein